MTSRREFIAGAGAMAAMMPPSAIIGAAAQTVTGGIRLHALIVGINSYSGTIRTPLAAGGAGEVRAIRPLRGCLNDVALIEAAVRPIASRVEILTEGDATRAAFLTSWRSVVDGARAGDSILVTFSGHGGLELDRYNPDKPTGHNPALLFSRFDSMQRANEADRLVSYEINELVQAARAKRVRVILVADCCHSGTLTRSVHPRVAADVSYRTAAIEAYDLQPAPVVAVKRFSREEADNLVYFGASQDHELTPEVPIDGRPHGALSVAFARALNGLSTSRADGAVTGHDLQLYVHRQVLNITDQLQHLNVKWPTPDARRGVRPDEVLFHVRPGARPQPTSAGDLPAIRLKLLGTNDAGASEIFGRLAGARPPNSDELAELTWDASDGAVTNGRDPIAASVARDDLQPVIDRARGLKIIDRLATRAGDLDVRLMQDGERIDEPSRDAGRTLYAGDERTLMLLQRRYAHLVVVNLTGNGTVQLLYPRRMRAGRDPLSVPPESAGFRPRLKVEPPFGADHVVALASARPTDDLVAALEALDGSKRPLEAVLKIRAHVEMGDAQVGFLGIFTARRN